MERWLAVPGWEGLYEVSDRGNFRSIAMRAGSRMRIFPLRMKRMRDGYLFVRFSRDKKQSLFNAHKLVAQVFVPNPFNKPQVNHKNSRRDDNRVENLEWCTPKENIAHATKHGSFDNSLKCLKVSRRLPEEVSVCHPPLPPVGYEDLCKACYMREWQIRRKKSAP